MGIVLPNIASEVRFLTFYRRTTMPKLAIYVPKKDMKQIEKWRKKINFSRVFMSALNREIRERTRNCEAATEELSLAATHYKAQLADITEPLVDLGYRLGTDQVLGCGQSAEAIVRLISIDENDIQPDDRQLLEAALKDNTQRVESFLRDNNFDDQSHPTWRNAVFRGYLKGVRDTWRRVCDEMNAL